MLFGPCATGVEAVPSDLARRRRVDGVECTSRRSRPPASRPRTNSGIRLQEPPCRSCATPSRRRRRTSRTACGATPKVETARPPSGRNYFRSSRTPRQSASTSSTPRSWATRYVIHLLLERSHVNRAGLGVRDGVRGGSPIVRRHRGERRGPRRALHRPEPGRLAVWKSNSELVTSVTGTTSRRWRGASKI